VYTTRVREVVFLPQPTSMRVTLTPGIIAMAPSELSSHVSRAYGSRPSRFVDMLPFPLLLPPLFPSLPPPLPPLPPP